MSPRRPTHLTPLPTPASLVIRQVKKRLLRSVDFDATSIQWVPLRGDENRSTFASSQAPRRVRDIVMVQAANEPDPENPLYGGTFTLRKSAGRKAVFKSFSLHFIDRTLDMEFESVSMFREVRKLSSMSLGCMKGGGQWRRQGRLCKRDSISPPPSPPLRLLP